MSGDKNCRYHISPSRAAEACPCRSKLGSHRKTDKGVKIKGKTSLSFEHWVSQLEKKMRLGRGFIRDAGFCGGGNCGPSSSPFQLSGGANKVQDDLPRKAWRWLPQKRNSPGVCGYQAASPRQNLQGGGGKPLDTWKGSSLNTGPPGGMRVVRRKLSSAENPTHLLTGEVVGNPRKRREGDRAETDASIQKPTRLSKMKGSVFTQHPHSTDRLS